MMYRVDGVERMPPAPGGMPNYQRKAEDFLCCVLGEDSPVAWTDPAGNRYFSAFPQSRGQELVTWGPVVIGHMLFRGTRCGAEDALFSFFDREAGLFLNAPGHRRIEFWYLFYVNMLAGAAYKALFPGDERLRRMLLSSAEAMMALAKKVGYDFNHQGYDFAAGALFTLSDLYRQPDAIGGYGYNMLFAGLLLGREDFVDEAQRALQMYQAMPVNPWYEIPSGSSALLAAAELGARGRDMDVLRCLSFALDPEAGCLQTGSWNGEPVDGLMMGWRGDTRQQAMDACYSMESLMPAQFMLPFVRRCPEAAHTVGRYLVNALCNFRLFYAEGSAPLAHSRPDLDARIPYERISREKDGHSPYVHGDFHGQRSVYGGAYVPWIAALLRGSNGAAHAFDAAATDWLADARPSFLIYNPGEDDAELAFSPGPMWQQRHPELFSGGYHLRASDARVADVPLSSSMRVVAPGRSAFVMETKKV